MVHSCHDLEQYVQFLELVEEAKAAGHKHPLKWTIQEAVRRNILKDYLERKGGEVLRCERLAAVLHEAPS